MQLQELNIDFIMQSGMDRDDRDLQIDCCDGSTNLPPPQAILNNIFLQPLIYFDIPVELCDITIIDKVTEECICGILTKVYNKLLANHIPYSMARQQSWNSIMMWTSFVRKYMPRYCGSMSLYSIAKTLVQPEIQPLIKLPLKQEEGNLVAETRIKTANKTLNKLFATRDALKYNCFLDMSETKVTKTNQMQQMVIAYGCRSDLDITMKKWIITQSAVSGLRNSADFATEILSARLSAYFNSVVIRDTQDFARLLKLACLKISKVHPGDCGNRITMPFVIKSTPKEYRDNFLYINIVEDGKRIVLTPEVIDNYLDREVQLINPFTCKHTDGTCEYCAGRADANILAYLPTGIHIGIYSATWLAELISQKVLSNKHLINTDSREYELLDIAKRFMYKVGDELFIQKSLKDYKNTAVIRIPLDAMQPITDLFQDELPNPESFSSIGTIELQLSEDDPTIELPIAHGGFTPFLSEQAMDWIKKCRRQLILDDEYLTIPLKNWDFGQPFLKYITLNFNMIKFSKIVIEFFKSSIRNYTSIPAALRDFTDLFYSKGELNFFYVEMIMKTFLYVDRTNYSTPLVTDVEHVKFDTLHNVASWHSLTTKMSFLKVHELFRSPDPCIREKPAGQFDIFFGLKNYK